MEKADLGSSRTKNLAEFLQKRNIYNPSYPKDSQKIQDFDGNLTANRKLYTSAVKSSYEKMSKNIPDKLNTLPTVKTSSESAENSTNLQETSNLSDQSTFRQQLEHDGNCRNNKSSISWQNKCDGSKNLSSSVKSQHFLGYDWIAALLGNDSNLMSEKESFFHDLKSFRQKFKDDCRKENYNEEPFRLIETEPQIIADVLTKSKLEPFTVNDRLFTEHMVKENATVYGKDRHRKNGSVRLARVSIPKSVLQPTYEVKPHRRGSFDSCDSFALKDHCLMGWENSQPAMIPHARSLDLSSEVTGHRVPHAVTTLEEVDKIYSGTQRGSHHELPSWKKYYLDTAKNMPALGVSNLRFSSKDNNKQRTDELLNSTHLISYEMEKTKKEREMESKGVI